MAPNKKQQENCVNHIICNLSTTYASFIKHFNPLPHVWYSYRIFQSTFYCYRAQFRSWNILQLSAVITYGSPCTAYNNCFSHINLLQIISFYLL